MTFIGFIIGFTIIIMSAREVYYREVFKMEDKNIRHYWMSIAYIAMLPFMPLCDFAKQYTLCTAGLLLITFIIEGTHEAVDEGYYQYLLAKEEQSTPQPRPDKLHLPFFCFEDTYKEYLEACIEEQI